MVIEQDRASVQRLFCRRFTSPPQNEHFDVSARRLWCLDLCSDPSFSLAPSWVSYSILHHRFPSARL